MQVTKQGLRNGQTKRCVRFRNPADASSFSLVQQDVVLSAFIRSLELLVLLCQDKRTNKLLIQLYFNPCALNFVNKRVSLSEFLNRIWMWFNIK